MDIKTWVPSTLEAFVFTSPWLLISLVLILGVEGNRGWIGVYLSLSVAFTVFAWFVRHKLEFGDRYLGYSSLFGGKKEITFQQIQSVITHKSVLSTSMPVRLTIVPIPDSGLDSININLKVFRKNDVEQILAAFKGMISREETGILNEWSEWL